MTMDGPKVSWSWLIVGLVGMPILTGVVGTCLNYGSHYQVGGWFLAVIVVAMLAGGALIWVAVRPAFRWLIPLYWLFTWGLMTIASLLTAVLVFHDGP